MLTYLYYFPSPLNETLVIGLLLVTYRVCHMRAELEGCRFNWQTDGRLANPAFDGVVSSLQCLLCANCKGKGRPINSNNNNNQDNVYSAMSLWQNLSRIHSGHLSECVPMWPPSRMSIAANLTLESAGMLP